MWCGRPPASAAAEGGEARGEQALIADLGMLSSGIVTSRQITENCVRNHVPSVTSPHRLLLPRQQIAARTDANRRGLECREHTRTTNKKTMCGAARINIKGGRWGGAASAVLS